MFVNFQLKSVKFLIRYNYFKILNIIYNIKMTDIQTRWYKLAD